MVCLAFSSWSRLRTRPPSCFFVGHRRLAASVRFPTIKSTLSPSAMAYLPLLPVSQDLSWFLSALPYPYTYHACSPDSIPMGRPRRVFPPRPFTTNPLPLNSTTQGPSAPGPVIAALVGGGRLLLSEYTPRYSNVSGQCVGERTESEGTIDGCSALQDQVS